MTSAPRPMPRRASPLLALARSPADGAARVLRDGSLAYSGVLVLAASAVAAIGALAFAARVPFESVVYGDTRSPAVTALLETLGRDRTAVIVYLLERAWPWLVSATALTPLFVWLLGSSAVHAAARLAGARRPYAPMLTLFGYATALTRIPADLVALAVPGPLAQLAGTAALVWLGVIAWRGIASHYALAGGRAMVTLLVAIGLFYLVPALLILAAVVAILIAAIVLEYVPAL